MDHNVSAAMRMVDDQEAANAAACLAEARENGFSDAEAEDCDDFSRNCVACPFRPRPDKDALSAIREAAEDRVIDLDRQVRLARWRRDRAAVLIGELVCEFRIGQIITTDDYAKAGKVYRLSRIGKAPDYKGAKPPMWGHKILKGGGDHATESSLYAWSSPWRLARADEIPGGAK